uniref:Prolyl 4-hydroxylase alpha-subunit N-terminal domain-containing protein n=1 Tax=Clastoptera arizonana TaxID=38151 RepID=A0A1B6D9G3_9HEMI
MHLKLFIFLVTVSAAVSVTVRKKIVPTLRFNGTSIKGINTIYGKALYAFRNMTPLLRNNNTIHNVTAKIILFNQLLDLETQMLQKIKLMFDTEGYNPWNSYEETDRLLRLAETVRNSSAAPAARLAEMESLYGEMKELREYLHIEGILWYIPLFEKVDEYDWENLTLENVGSTEEDYGYELSED